MLKWNLWWSIATCWVESDKKWKKKGDVSKDKLSNADGAASAPPFIKIINYNLHYLQREVDDEGNAGLSKNTLNLKKNTSVYVSLTCNQILLWWDMVLEPCLIHFCQMYLFIITLYYNKSPPLMPLFYCSTWLSWVAKHLEYFCGSAAEAILMDIVFIRMFLT